MAKKKKSNLYIDKRIDSIGRNYFIDKDGQRRSGVEYSLQWSDKGRVKKEVFEEGLQLYSLKDIKTKDQGRTFTTEAMEIEGFKDLRKREIELMESDEKNDIIFYDLPQVVDQHPDYKFKILKPDGSIFYNYNQLQAMEHVDNFVDSVKNTINEVKKQTGGSPLPQVSILFDDINKEITIDLKNVQKFVDASGEDVGNVPPIVQGLIRDEFKT